MNELLAQHPAIPKLRRIVQRIALMSHASAACLEPTAPDSTRDIGGNRPPGEIDIRGDLTDEGYRQKSHIYFERKLRRCGTAGEVEALLKEAEQALIDWMKTPEVAGVEVERGSFYWKCKIADEDDSLQTLIDRYSVSKATVYRYRATYRGLRKKLADKAV